MIAVIGLLAATPLIDGALPSRSTDHEPVQLEGSLSTGWYCPSPAGAGFLSVMSTTNHAESPVSLRRWAVGEARSSPFLEGVLGAHRRVQVSVADLGVASATALAETFGGVTTADLTVVSQGGLATSACTVQPWNRWYFSIASTARDQDTALLVSNPFEEEAVVRVRQFLPDREISPALLKRVVIPKLSQLTIDLKEFIPATPSFGLEVTATVGRVVVSRLSRRGGLSLNVGTRQPATRWLFAGGQVPVAGDELLVITNPSDKESLVQIAFQTDGQAVAPPSLQEVALAAGRQLTVKVSDHLERGIRHSSSVSSLNDVSIVVERQTFGEGFENVLGVSSSRRRWVVPVGTAAGTETISILNDSAVQATVHIALITETAEFRPVELADLQVGPGTRLSVALTGFVNGAATAVVEAISGKIVIERHLAGQSDITTSPGIALPD